MTTRKELLGHVRAAIDDELERQDEANEHAECSSCLRKGGGPETTELAYAAIEAVYKAIGDHQLAVMIGDTGQRPRTVHVAVEEPEGVEMLQDDDEDET